MVTRHILSVYFVRKCRGTNDNNEVGMGILLNLHSSFFLTFLYEYCA